MEINDIQYVKVSDHGPISLDCIFQAICPNFKVTQVFLQNLQHVEMCSKNV